MLRQHIVVLLQHVVDGLSNGAVYSLVALGFGCIYYATKTFHVAHGAFAAAGAYVCYALLASAHLPIAVAAAGGLMAAMLLGVLAEWGVYYPLVEYSGANAKHAAAGSPVVSGVVAGLGGSFCYAFLVDRHPHIVATGVVAGLAAIVLAKLTEKVTHYLRVHVFQEREASPQASMISSMGMYIAMVSLTALIFGSQLKVLVHGTHPRIGFAGVGVTRVQLAQLAAAGLVCCGMALFVQRTHLGRILRALADDSEVVSVLGHDVRMLRLFVFALGSGLGGAGGILAAMDVGVDPFGGLSLTLVAAAAAIVGGSRSFMGPALGGFLMGVAQGFFVWMVSAKWSTTVVYGLLLLLVLFRREALLILSSVKAALSRFLPRAAQQGEASVRGVAR